MSENNQNPRVHSGSIMPRAPLPWLRELDDVSVAQYEPRRCRVIKSVGGL
jgi:hypothetical protein